MKWFKEKTKLWKSYKFWKYWMFVSIRFGAIEQLRVFEKDNFKTSGIEIRVELSDAFGIIVDFKTLASGQSLTVNGHFVTYEKRFSGEPLANKMLCI